MHWSSPVERSYLDPKSPGGELGTGLELEGPVGDCLKSGPSARGTWQSWVLES